MPLSLVIASQSGRAYFTPMAAITRLLTLLALVLMPFGMSPASAKSGHHAPPVASAQHSDGHAHHDGHGGQPAEPAPDDAINCAVACSMMMIAEAHIEHSAPAVRLPAERALFEMRAGLHLGPATPPPKRF